MSGNIHVYPRYDLINHELVGDECVCGPTVTPEKLEDGSVAWVISHHTLDRRNDDS